MRLRLGEHDKLLARVMKLAKEGLGYKQIADRVGISDRSVARIVKALERENEQKNTTES